MIEFEQFAQLAQRCIKENCDIDIDIKEDTMFQESGIDSVGTLMLMSQAEDELNLKIPPKAFSQAKTFGDLFKSAQ